MTINIDDVIKSIELLKITGNSLKNIYGNQ